MSAIRRRTAWRNGTATAALLIALTPLALVLPVAVSGSAWADPAPVRAHAHPTFGRMVFDWAGAVDFNARVEGNRLLVTFSRPIETQAAAAAGALPQYLSGGRVEPDGRTVAFDLKQPVTLKTFRSGTKVAVDLIPAPASAGAAPPPSPAAPSPAPVAAPPAAPAAPAATATPAAATATSAATSPAPPRVPSRPGLKVPVRAADHPDHSRLVFDWPEDASYALQRDGQGVTLLFNKAAAAQLPKGDLRNIRSLESFPQANGALAVTFVAPADSDVRDYKNGKSLVVDVRNPGTRQAPAAAPAASPPAPAAPPQTTASPPVIVPTPAAPLPPGATTTGVRGALPVAPPPAPVPTPPAGAESALVPPAAVAPAKDGLALTFDAGGPAAMAAFARGGFFYVVFDKPMPIGAGVVTGEQKELLGAVEPVPATGGSVYRTRVGPLLWPKIERKGTVWTITPSTRLATAPPEELSVSPQPEFLLGARLLVRAADPGSAVQFTDPDVGDRLQVAPLPAPSFAVTRSHRYPDLEIVPSFHGVVVRPITDAVTVRAVKEGVEVSAAGGLRLSSAEDTGGPAAIAALNAAENKAGSAPGGGTGQTAAPASGFAVREPAPLFPEQNNNNNKGKRLFDFTAWQHGGAEHYTEARQKLQLTVAEATDEDRPRAVLDLARFYLAHGMGQEAVGLLGVLSGQQPDLEAWPEFKALRGVGRYLSGDFAGALDDLSSPGLAENTEAGLWRAAAAANRRDWSVAAAGFRSAGPVLASYPDPLLTRLSTEAADAFLRAGQPDYAQNLLDRLIARIGSEADSVPMMQYLRGEVARLREDNELAHEMLNNAFNSLDRLVRAKAGLALTNLERAEGKISIEGAADRLMGLTFVWRGDELEMDIRQRLGEIYVEGGQFANGFNSLKETAAMQPDSPRAAAIAAFMQRTFADLFKDGGTKLPVLEAMQFYDRYRELTPVGEEGDEVIRQLAERLAAIDLLARASDLYEHQVRFRLGGLDKARAGTRLASLRLLDNKPEDAIRALEFSNVGGLPADLEAERRTMHAKALAELGREPEALQLLARDDSRPADLLRVDIAWKAQKWEQAAIALSKVIGKPPANGKALDGATSQLVLNRAVALALAGDGTGLNTMRKDFGAVMAAGPDADAFRVLTRPEQATGLIDVDTIRSRVAEVDVFQNFLKGYRTRIGQPGAGQPAAPAKAAPNS
jgi:tetratricopeptide (TPR) repeat protein